ncbi:MAG TPA: hypothetical protein VFZ00_30805 [Solirubrobacter sp.]|nr:hypothetical protein [Solirubrobacter sp.]
MSPVSYHHPSRREILGDLFHRLARVDAAGHTIQSLANSPDTTAITLADALESLEHDLLLAAREVESVKARITR